MLLNKIVDSVLTDISIKVYNIVNDLQFYVFSSEYIYVWYN